MKYIRELGLAGLLVAFGCKAERKPYKPYEGETVFKVREEKLEDNLWVQVVESQRPNLKPDPRYKIFLTNDAGQKYPFYLGFNSEAECRAVGFTTIVSIVRNDGRIKDLGGANNFCDYFPK